MFVKRGHQGFGQFDFISDLALPLLKTAISLGGQYAIASVSAGAAKDVAQTQQQTAMMQSMVQENVAKLQLQTQLASKGVTSTQQGGQVVATGTVPSSTSEAGFSSPLMILLIAGLGMGMIFMMKKKK